MHFIEKKGLLFMTQGSKIGIVCCSNGLRPEQAETIKMLVQILEKSGLEALLSPYLYGDENGQAGTARERAGALMKFYEDDSVTDIFDVSGGDMANEILSYLDFQTIAYEKKHFWGYSDLTTIINAIYARTGKSSVLYQIRNLTYDHSQSQITDFLSTTLRGPLLFMIFIFAPLFKTIHFQRVYYILYQIKLSFQGIVQNCLFFF